MAIGLSRRANLHLTSPSPDLRANTGVSNDSAEGDNTPTPEASFDRTVVIASDVNSFTIASNFLIFTTTAHVAHFAPLSALPDLLLGHSKTSESGPDGAQGWETRRVERGSRIVTAVPSAMSLVLQMPRGNLETIYPRPLVLEVVKQDIDR